MTREFLALKQELEQHKEYCERRFKDGEKKFSEMIDCQKATNTRLDKLIDNTAGLVNFYTEATQAGNFAKRIRGWFLTIVTYTGFAGVCYLVYSKFPLILAGLTQ
jgi:hypothetical protein